MTENIYNFNIYMYYKQGQYRLCLCFTQPEVPEIHWFYLSVTFSYFYLKNMIRIKQINLLYLFVDVINIHWLIIILSQWKTISISKTEVNNPFIWAPSSWNLCLLRVYCLCQFNVYIQASIKECLYHPNAWSMRAHINITMSRLLEQIQKVINSKNNSSSVQNLPNTK